MAPNKQRRSIALPNPNNPFRPMYQYDDGYYYVENPDGTLSVQDVDENGNLIKHSYIGSNAKTAKEQNKETRAKYWQQAPIIRHATDSIAEAYGINPELLRDRLNHEGFVDESIKVNNRGKDSSSYNTLNTNYEWADKNGKVGSPGFVGFGLDWGADNIQKGKVKLINENWSDSHNTNEKGTLVHTSDGNSNKDNIGIVAAHLKYFRDKAAKQFPNASPKRLDEIAGIYYNQGEYTTKIKK